MASPTQTIVGKGTPNPLIADDLLKNPKWTWSHALLQNLLPILIHGIVGPLEYSHCYANIIPLAMKNFNTP